MGSGLVKCFVSNQTIPENAEVVVFPIVKTVGFYSADLEKGGKTGITAQQHHNSTCYSNCFWEFVGIKLDAISSDYAKTELKDTPDNRISILGLMNFLSRSSYKTNKGKENEYHEHGYDIKKMLNMVGSLNKDEIEDSDPALLKFKQVEKFWDELTSLVDSNRVFASSYSGVPVQFQLAVCLKSAYDYAVNRSSKNSYHIRRKQSNIDRFDEIKNERLNTEFAKKYKEIVYSDFLKEVLNLERTSDSTTMGYTSFLYSYLQRKTSSLKDISLDTVTEAEEDLKFVIDFILFQEFINRVQVIILPVYGYHQDYENEDGNEYLKMVKQVNKELNLFIKEKYKD